MGISYIRDYKSGYIKLLLQRMSVHEYIIKSLLKSILLGALALTIPYLIYVIHLFVQPNLNGPLVLEKGKTVILFLPQLAESNGIGYVAVLGLFVCFSGCVFSVFAIGISVWVMNEFLTVFIPFLICIFVAIVTPDNKWDLLLLYSPNGYEGVSVCSVLLMGLGLFMAGIILFVVGVYRNENKEYKKKRV